LIRKHKEKKLKFSEEELWSFTLQMSSALDYLHRKYIIHRDIKALNVLVTKQRQIKVWANRI
jgi:serine/threonine protein kinase